MALADGHAEVMAARRAEAQAALELAVEDLRLAAGALRPGVGRRGASAEGELDGQSTVLVALSMQEPMRHAARPARAAPHRVRGHADADRRADRAGHDEPPGWRRRSDGSAGRGAGQPRPETRLEPRRDGRGGEGGAKLRRRRRRGAGLRARAAAVAAATLGDVPSSTPRWPDRGDRPRRMCCHHAPANTAEPKRYTPRPRSAATPPARGARQLAQRAMLEHPDGARAAAEHGTDLARREPVHEAQHDHLAAVVGQRRERRAEPRPSSARRPAAQGRRRLPIGSGTSSSDAVPMPAARAERVGELVVGDAEQPRAEGRALVAIAIDGAEGGEERALGDVLGVVVVAEQVEAVAVDAVEVAAIQRPERRAVALRRAHVGEVGVLGRPARASRSSNGSCRRSRARTRTTSPLVMRHSAGSRVEDERAGAVELDRAPGEASGRRLDRHVGAEGRARAR